MTRFPATYLDGKTSRARPAEVRLEGTAVSVRGPEGELLAEAQAGDCRLSEPLGRTARMLRLPGGASCEIEDPEGALTLGPRGKSQRVEGCAHWLENRWGRVLGALLGLAVAVAALFGWGLPALSERVSRAVPEPVAAHVGRQALDLLDRGLLAPSQLPPQRAEGVRSAFRSVCVRMVPRTAYRLELRRSPTLGPNAFAVPGRVVVVTDELVDFVRSGAELEGVIAHEIGHGEARHCLRTVFEQAGVFLILSALLGDVTSLSSTAAALPAVLARTGYSRAFEREADEAAGRYLLGARGSTAPLRAVLLRLDEKNAGVAGPSLLSTHPPGKERARRLETLESAYRPRRAMLD